jgi:hypothetical protein
MLDGQVRFEQHFLNFLPPFPTGKDRSATLKQVGNGMVGSFSWRLTHLYRVPRGI